MFERASGYILYFAFVAMFLGGVGIIAVQGLRLGMGNLALATQAQPPSRVDVGLAAQAGGPDKKGVGLSTAVLAQGDDAMSHPVLTLAPKASSAGLVKDAPQVLPEEGPAQIVRRSLTNGY